MLRYTSIQTHGEYNNPSMCSRSVHQIIKLDYDVLKFYIFLSKFELQFFER